jgi:arginase
MKAIQIIGVPSDFGASELGSSLGPDALRISGLPASLRKMGMTVVDSGNLNGPSSLFEAVNQPNSKNTKYLEQVTLWNQLLHQEILKALSKQDIPLVLGGDHSLAIGSISAVARFCSQQQKKLKIVWIDAHADANTPTISPSGNLHGMPVSSLLGHGYHPLCDLVEQDTIHAEQFHLVGIRSVDSAEKEFVHQLGLDIFDMRYIDEFGINHVMKKILADCAPNTHLHVSFDLDGLDPSIAPGTSTRVEGGLSYREIQLMMEMMADTQCVGSVDLVELNPLQDIRNQTALLAIDLLESLFGKTTLIRKTQ